MIVTIDLATYETSKEVITIRDRFAMAALAGMLAACNGPAWGRDVFPLASSAYEYADQMMEARAK